MVAETVFFVSLKSNRLAGEKTDTARLPQTHVDNSFGNSYDFTLNNVLGTHKLLEAARRYGGVRRFIHVSSDEVYGERSFCSGTASMECATLEPTNPYSASKAAAEMIVKVRSHQTVCRRRHFFKTAMWVDAP